MTELIQHTNGTDLAQQMDYAKAVSSGDLLPAAYRGKPANVLIALGLGQAMGLSPAESLYRIDVIQGKPTASAELIAANVRKAGHVLRVRLDEKAMSATATIIRADDPDFEHTVTRDMEWAKTMGLQSKDNYKKQPLTMLQHRAVTACARMACPEALYGVAYTADEMRESPSFTADTPERVTAGAFMTKPTDPAEDVTEGELEPEPITDKTRRHLFALFTQKGVAEDQQLAGINYRLGTSYTSRKELTEDNGQALIEYLGTLPDADTTGGDDQ